MTLNLKQHDRRPWFVAQLRNADGTGVNITGATAVVVIVRRQGQTAPLFRRALELLTTQPPIPAKYDNGTNVTDLNGWVRYKWAAGDTNTVGTYDVEVEVNWAGEPQTFPTVGYYTVTIGDDLDDVQP